MEEPINSDLSNGQRMSFYTPFGVGEHMVFELRLRRSLHRAAAVAPYI